ncbi:MAG: hypothetical protein M8364_00700 [Methylobacter sp.]|uniref:hypothetical protein n=1 Tax=Methylobacter sp. TaxID=2051955 RepID=UPI002590BAC2|nr:hypothetical protein [Methylobacter sp.]MCL7419411.1 hypothetical protein [Methylobacter sp.]
MPVKILPLFKNIAAQVKSLGVDILRPNAAGKAESVVIAGLALIMAIRVLSWHKISLSPCDCKFLA